MFDLKFDAVLHSIIMVLMVNCFWQPLVESQCTAVLYLSDVN